MVMTSREVDHTSRPGIPRVTVQKDAGENPPFNWRFSQKKDLFFSQIYVSMDQYLLIPFLGGWTSIYQLFWCSPGVQGFDPSPCEFTIVYPVVEIRGAATCSDQRYLTHFLEVIAIAHRLSTIRAYDEICVLQNGEIATWWKSQLGGAQLSVGLEV